MAANGPHDEPAAPGPSQWVQRYGDTLFRYAMERVDRQAVAEDLVQETLLAGLAARERFQGESTEQTWLVGILRRKIADHFRKQSRERAFVLDESTDSESRQEFDRRGHWSYQPGRWPRDPAETLEDREFWAVFERCLSSLPPPLGETFSLREVEGLKTEEVCKILGLTATNMGVRLYRARSLLRRCLELHWFAGPAK
jgi:RNA polymerase sigma-70 factor (ECF subfamily)